MQKSDSGQIEAGNDYPKTEKHYEGKRSHGECFVTADGRALDPRFDLRTHSPTGFEWGYGGSGPAQLALALLADWLFDDGQALDLYQAFKSKTVAGFRREGWRLTGKEIDEALRTFRHNVRV
jgi:hypothetical protein